MVRLQQLLETPLTKALTQADLATAVRMLDSAPLGTDIASGYKPSLPGVQRKLLVGRAASGAWQRPEGASPSTWILKPDGRTAMAQVRVRRRAIAAGSSDCDPGLRRLPDLRDLLARVAFNSARSNADAHAKNTSFLHLSDGAVVQLAPADDLVSTMAPEPSMTRDDRHPTIHEWIRW
jgi:hypothetical protein